MWCGSPPLFTESTEGPAIHVIVQLLMNDALVQFLRHHCVCVLFVRACVQKKSVCCVCVVFLGHYF